MADQDDPRVEALDALFDRDEFFSTADILAAADAVDGRDAEIERLRAENERLRCREVMQDSVAETGQKLLRIQTEIRKRAESERDAARAEVERLRAENAGETFDRLIALAESEKDLGDESHFVSLDETLEFLRAARAFGWGR